MENEYFNVKTKFFPWGTPFNGSSPHLHNRLNYNLELV